MIITIALVGPSDLDKSEATLRNEFERTDVSAIIMRTVKSLYLVLI